MSFSFMTFVVVMAVFWTINSGRRRRRRIQIGDGGILIDHDSDEETARRLANLESTIAARDEEMDRLHERVAELESRLDFTERLLATPRQDPNSGTANER
jgi:hypothetical protein